MLRARLYSADRVHFDVDSEAIARYQAMKWATGGTGAGGYPLVNIQEAIENGDL